MTDNAAMLAIKVLAGLWVAVAIVCSIPIVLDNRVPWLPLALCALAFTACAWLLLGYRRNDSRRPAEPRKDERRKSEPAQSTGNDSRVRVQ